MVSVSEAVSLMEQCLADVNQTEEKNGVVVDIMNTITNEAAHMFDLNSQMQRLRKNNLSW